MRLKIFTTCVCSVTLYTYFATAKYIIQTTCADKHLKDNDVHYLLLDSIR